MGTYFQKTCKLTCYDSQILRSIFLTTTRLSKSNLRTLPRPRKILHQIIPNRFQRDHCIVILFRARGGGEALHTACLERYMGMSALKTPFSHLSSSSQGSHFKQKSLKLRGIARGGQGARAPLVSSSAPLTPK